MRGILYNIYLASNIKFRIRAFAYQFVVFNIPLIVLIIYLII